MNKSSYQYILKYLLFIVISVWTPICYAQYSDSVEFDTVKASHFASGQLEAHYEKHGYQFGHITREQYLKGAQALLDATPGGDILEKIRRNGDIEHFRVSTGEFAVMTKRGRIRTYFKTNYSYWLRK